MVGGYSFEAAFDCHNPFHFSKLTRQRYGIALQEARWWQPVTGTCKWASPQPLKSSLSPYASKIRCRFAFSLLSFIKIWSGTLSMLWQTYFFSFQLFLEPFHFSKQDDILILQEFTIICSQYLPTFVEILLLPSNGSGFVFPTLYRPLPVVVLAQRQTCTLCKTILLQIIYSSRNLDGFLFACLRGNFVFLIAIGVHGFEFT